MVKYKTYSNAFKWKMVLYSINDMKLPFALVIEQIVYFGVGLAVVSLFYLIFRIMLLGNPLVHFLFLPGIFTASMMKLNPEDKKPLYWLFDNFKHIIKDPKEQWNFEKPKRRKEGCFDSVAFRR